MQLTCTDQGYFGAFGSTYTNVALSLPYRGRVQVFPHPECGYFYTLGAGSFTYAGITFRAQIFLFHTPRSVLFEHPFNPDNSTALIDDMAQRSLTSRNEFLNFTQLESVPDGSVITGLLSTGAASFGFDWFIVDVDIDAGLTNYFYHSNEDRSFKAGMFGAVDAKAELNLCYSRSMWMEVLSSAFDQPYQPEVIAAFVIV